MTPIAAARTGLTTVTVASGAASPAPRYDACERSTPVPANPAMASRLAHSAVGACEVQSTATVLVKTDAAPKATPAAVASTMLRTTGLRMRRATRKSTAIPPKVASARTVRSPPGSDPLSAPPVSARSPARPTVAMIAPRQAAAPALRRTNTAAIGSAKTMVSAPSGCTRLSGP